jgi:hypothetical protein
LGLYPLSRFNLSLLVGFCKYFSKAIFDFDLDKQHPIWVMILPISEVGSSHRFLLPLCLNVLVYAHMSVGVFMRTPFFLSAWWIPSDSEWWITCGCLAVFPRLFR